MHSKSYNGVERYLAVDGDLRVIKSIIKRNEDVFGQMNIAERLIMDTVQDVVVSAIKALNADNGFPVSSPVLTQQYNADARDGDETAAPYRQLLDDARDSMYLMPSPENAAQNNAVTYGYQLVDATFNLNHMMTRNFSCDAERFSGAMARLRELKTIFKKGASPDIDTDYPRAKEAEKAAIGMIAHAVQAMHRDNGLPTMVRVPSRDNRMP